MRVQAKEVTRKQRFDAALALAGLSLGEWAEKQGVSRQHLYLVLTDERTPGAELDAAITGFIAKHLPPEAA